MFDATKETLMLLHVVIFLGTYHFYNFLYGFADFKGPADHGFIQYFRAGYMYFVCFKVRIVE